MLSDLINLREQLNIIKPSGFFSVNLNNVKKNLLEKII